MDEALLTTCISFSFPGWYFTTVLLTTGKTRFSSRDCALFVDLMLISSLCSGLRRLGSVYERRKALCDGLYPCSWNNLAEQYVYDKYDSIGTQETENRECCIDAGKFGHFLVLSIVSTVGLTLSLSTQLVKFGDQLDDAALGELATGPVIKRLNLATHTPGGLDECTREMFSLAMLVRLGKVTEEDIKLTFAAFRKLDVHDDGVLNSKSIIAGMIQKRKNISCLNLKNLGEVQPQFHQPSAQQNVAQQKVAQQSYGAVNSSFSNSWGNGGGYGQQWFESNTTDMPNGDSAPEDVQNGGLSAPTELSSFVPGQSPYNSNSAYMQSKSLRRGGFSH
jgi:hypothetical protein